MTKMIQKEIEAARRDRGKHPQMGVKAAKAIIDNWIASRGLNK